MPKENLFDTEDLPIDVGDHLHQMEGKSYYEELVGENKKFKDNETLARSKAMSDQYIERLLKEKDELRSDLETRLSYEEFLDQIKTTPIPPQRGNPAIPEREETHQDKSAMNPRDFERLVEQKLNQFESQRIAQQNVNTVRSRLLEVLGPNYAQSLKRQAIELNVSEQFLQELAATNPKAFYKMIDLDEKSKESTTFQAPPRTQQITSSTNTRSKQGWSHYEQIRKNSPLEYHSPKVQNEMFSRINEIGEDNFYNS